MEPERERGAKRRWWIALGILLLLGGVSGAVGDVVSHGRYRVFVVPSRSMSPTLVLGDRFFISGGQAPHRGEVWVHQEPGGRLFVKRVIGLPGETVQVTGGGVVVDGQALSEPYLAAPPAYSTRPVHLGPQQYYLLGDNRNNSNDSHLLGPVSRGALLGRARLRYWPPNRAGGIR